FDTWLDDLQLYLLSDSRDSISLFDHTSGAAPTPPATNDSATRSQWLTRDAAARLAIRNHLPLAECAHFGQHKTAKALYSTPLLTPRFPRRLLPCRLSTWTFCLQLRERFCQDLPALRLNSVRGGEFSSDLLRDFCRGEGILQSFMLPDSPQQNGIAERRIGLVMEVAHTSMIHAAAPHFLWPFAVRYAAHQLNLWPRVSLPETSPTLHWTGKVGDASVFWVRGSRPFVRDTSADKLSVRAIPCVFLGFVPNAHGWQFYHPTSHRVFPSQDVTFDESVPFYRLFPYRSAPPPPPLFLAPGPPPVAVDSSDARGAASGGAASGGAEPGGAEHAGVESGVAEPEGVEHGGAESGGAEPRGTTSSRAHGAGDSAAGDTGAGGAGVNAGAGGTGGAAAAGPGGARTRGTRAAGTGSIGGAGPRDSTEPGAAGTGGTGAEGTGTGGAEARGVGAVGAGAGGTGAGGAGAGG
ncbi:unnamed protein product, partial [Closterium sp. NIES-54]